MSITSPLPHPANPLLTGLTDLVFKMASPGRPCGLAHIASRPRTGRYAAGVTVVTASVYPHIPRSCTRHPAHGTAPHALSSRTFPLRITSRYGNTPLSWFSGHVGNQWSRSLAHAWWSRPHATSRPLGHVLIPPHVPPGDVPLPTVIPSL